MTDARVSKYITGGRKRVPGWFLRLDAEAIATIMLDQKCRKLKGDALEIGVHHGRSFILLNLCLADNEKAIAIDIFEKQELNIEGGSGKGDLEKFKSNLRKFGDESRTKIVSASSLDLTIEKLSALTDGLRFASIDGGHWFGAVLNDLRLAATCAARDCVIALDDFFNHDFPEVSAAYYRWLEDKPEFIPLCCTRGKLYLCRPDFKTHYVDRLLKNNYIRFHLKKRISFLENELLILTGRFGGTSGVIQKYLSFYAPSAYEFIKRWKNGDSSPAKARSVAH